MTNFFWTLYDPMLFRRHGDTDFLAKMASHVG
jgi:hypothetical protein